MKAIANRDNPLEKHEDALDFANELNMYTLIENAIQCQKEQEKPFRKTDNLLKDALPYVTNLHHVVRPIGHFRIQEKYIDGNSPMYLRHNQGKIQLYSLSGNPLQRMPAHQYFYVMKNVDTLLDNPLLNRIIHYGDRYYLAKASDIQQYAQTIDEGAVDFKHFNSMQLYNGICGEQLVREHALATELNALTVPLYTYQNHLGLNYRAYESNMIYRKDPTGKLALDVYRQLFTTAYPLYPSKPREESRIPLHAEKSVAFNFKSVAPLSEKVLAAKIHDASLGLFRRTTTNTLHYGIASYVAESVYYYSIFVTTV